MSGFDVKRQIFPESRPHRRDLDDDDYRRICIPRRFWGSEIRKVDMTIRNKPKTAKEMLIQYIDNYPEYESKGVGFWIAGPNGNGKTSLSVCLAIEVRRMYRTSFFLSASMLRGYVINGERFDEHETVWERAMDVDFLVIDDFGKGAGDSKGFTQGLYTTLLRHRSSELKPTVVTTNAGPKSLVDSGMMSSSVVEVVKESMIVVELVGKNKRSDSLASVKKGLLG